MRIISGLVEGQVLQRRGVRGATAVVRVEGSRGGHLLATVSRGERPLAGWKRKKVSVRRKSDDAFFTLVGLPTGGPYRLHLDDATGGRVAEIKEFFVGDVWILAGQSNMEGAGLLPGRVDPHPLVRAFSLRREWRIASDPLHVQAESPDDCHNKGNEITSVMAEDVRLRMAIGSGPGLPFGLERLRRSSVPQGLICAALGGSALSLWNPEERNQLYDSMLASVRATGQPVAGVVWYQGESDTSEKTTPAYMNNMRRLVAAKRSDLGQPRLPWIIVQLARVFRSGDSRHWNSVQEQQRLLPEAIKDLAMVAAIDLPLDDEIHIGADGMSRLGSRLAHAADHITPSAGARGGRKKTAIPLPALASVRRAHSTEKTPAPKCAIDVTFSGVEGGLRADGEPSGFTLHDATGVELPWIYRTTLLGTTARLHVMRLPPPGSTVRYGHGYAPRCNLTDGRDLAMPLFAGQPIGGTENLLPFVTDWRVSQVVPTSAGIETLKSPPTAVMSSWGDRTYPNGFVNEHDNWARSSGHAFFAASIELKTTVSLEFLMGYDGPFRLWLDGKSFYCDPRGANPCIADESVKRARLAAGRHTIIVGMDVAHGRSWGFFLRFRAPERESAERLARAIRYT